MNSKDPDKNVILCYITTKRTENMGTRLIDVKTGRASLFYLNLLSKIKARRNEKI